MSEFKQRRPGAGRPAIDVPVQTADGPRTFRLRALPSRRFRELVGEHEDDADAAVVAVLLACTADSDLDEAACEALPDEAFEALCEAAWALNRS